LETLELKQPPIEPTTGSFMKAVNSSRLFLIIKTSGSLILISFEKYESSDDQILKY
jgi:hypothetical protein